MKRLIAVTLKEVAVIFCIFYDWPRKNENQLYLGNQRKSSQQFNESEVRPMDSGSKNQKGYFDPTTGQSIVQVIRVLFIFVHHFIVEVYLCGGVLELMRTNH